MTVPRSSEATPSVFGNLPLRSLRAIALHQVGTPLKNNISIENNEP